MHVQNKISHEIARAQISLFAVVGQFELYWLDKAQVHGICANLADQRWHIRISFSMNER